MVFLLPHVFVSLFCLPPWCHPVSPCWYVSDFCPLCFHWFVLCFCCTWFKLFFCYFVFCPCDSFLFLSRPLGFVSFSFVLSAFGSKFCLPICNRNKSYSQHPLSRKAHYITFVPRGKLPPHVLIDNFGEYYSIFNYWTDKYYGVHYYLWFM